MTIVSKRAEMGEVAYDERVVGVSSILLCGFGFSAAPGWANALYLHAQGAPDAPQPTSVASAKSARTHASFHVGTMQVIVMVCHTDSHHNDSNHHAAGGGCSSARA